MTTHNNDERLLEALAEGLASSDPIPDHVLAAAKGAIFWRTIDAELAELVFDSAQELMTSVRSSETARQITFRSPGVEIEIMVSAEGSRQLVGQLVPPQPAGIELRFGQQLLATSTDRLGRFTFPAIQPGSVQLVVRPEVGAVVVTEWVVV